MRDNIPAALTTASQSNYRKPEATVIIRDMLLRFGTVTPASASPLTAQATVKACPMDADVRTGGGILQASVYDQTALKYRTSTAGNAPTGVWSTYGTAMSYCVPGVLLDTVYYVDSSGVLKGVLTTGPSAVATVPAVTFTGKTALAPSNSTHLFVAESIDDYVQFHHVDTSGSLGAKTTSTYRVYGNTTLPVAAPAYAIVQNFDAFTLDGTTHFIIFNAQTDGMTKCFTWRNGVWGDPFNVIPPDYTQFMPYRMTVINGLAFLTGRMTRVNMTGYSPEIECYLYSRDGYNWTILSRQSYVGPNDVRGKLLLSGSKLFYLGQTYYQEAPATYFVGYEATAKKETVTTRVHGFSVNYPAAKTAPEASVSLANGDNYFKTTGIVKAGSEAWISAGYSGSQAQLAHVSLEGTSKGVNNGQVTYDLQASDVQFKALRNWSNPCYLDLRSEVKHHDPCANKDSLEAMGDGLSWDTHSGNLIMNNPGFESTFTSGSTGITGWAAYHTGTVTGTFIQRSNMDENGTDQSLGGMEIQKLSGAGTTEQWGLECTSTISATAGQRYVASISTYVKELPDGGEVRLEVTGNFGAAGVANTLRDTKTLTGGWDLLSVPFTNESTTSATITFRIYVTKAATSIFVVDNFSVEGDGLDALAFNQKDTEGIMFSSAPFETTDFDIRGKFSSTVTTAGADVQQHEQRIGFGLIGLAADADNFVVLKVFRNNTGSSHDADNVQLWKKRGGVYTRLDTPTHSFNIDANTDYWIRLTYQGGLFQSYVGPENAAGGADWGTPIISYQWTSTTDVPCPTTTGKGKVGVWAQYRPYRFHIYGVHPHALYMPLKFTNDLDWSKFSGLTGRVIVDDEVMMIDQKVLPTYGGVNFYNVVTPNDGVHPMGSYLESLRNNPDGQDFAAGYGIPAYSPYVQPTFVNVANGGHRADGAWNYHCLVMTSGPAAGRVWFVHRSFDERYYLDGISSHGKVREWCVVLFLGQDGNEYMRPGRGWAKDLIDSAGGKYTSTFQISPCLQVSRGVLGHTIVAHSDNSLLYYYTDDKVVLKVFEAFDYEHDNNTEMLIKRICAAAGVVDTQFGNILNYSLDATTTPAIIEDDLYTSLNLQDFDLTMGISSGLTYGLYFRDDGIHRAQLNLAPTGCTYYRNGAQISSATYTATYPYRVRLVVNAAWITLYINDAIVFRVYDDALVGQALNHLYLFTASGSGTVALRIPELHDWRDAIYVDNDSDAMSGLGNAIGERYILYISRSGEAIKFSAFDSKTNLNTYSNIIYSETLAPDESGIVTFLRVYGEEIMEVQDYRLANEYGLIFKAVQMPKASKALAGQMINRLFRQVRESLERRQVSLVADPRVEPEDYCTLSYATVGTGITPETIGGSTTPVVIINDVQYQYGSAQFEMTIGTRRYQSGSVKAGDAI